MNKRIQLIGLDMSLTGTGWCDRISTPIDDVFTGRISTTPNFNTRRERVIEIVKAVLSRVGEHYFTIFLIESYAFAKKTSSVVQLGELGGVIRQVIYKTTGFDAIEVPIGSLKKYMTGKGTGKKEDMKLWAYKKFREDFSARSNDECDAFCLVQLGLDLFNLRERKLNQKEQEAIDATIKYSDYQIDRIVKELDK